MSIDRTKSTRPSKTSEALPAASFSPEALAALLAEVSETRKAMAEQMAELTALKAAVADKPAKISVAGKSDKQVANEIAVVRAFKKAGFGTVTPHKDVKTFNRFLADGFRPKEGSKSLRVGGLRLFHVSQCRSLTSEEKAALKSMKQPAALRKGNAATVTELHPQ
jgi:hypothetical protein